MTTYKLIKDPTDNIIRSVLKDSSYFIPFDNGNTDYQEYLAWVAEGNTAEEAD
tara:strand:+ start:360 stop:518 length:159 start_codon:yes stop_codon:yes gene_type:complete